MTQVIIDDIIPRTQLVATAGQTVFNTNWTANDETDILVYARADGVEPDDATQLVNSNQYNVTFIGDSQTVRVTFLSPRTENDVITIVRNTPAERQNLYINTNFTPSMLNQDFGILTLVDQQAQMYDWVVQPRYNVSATIDVPADTVLPTLGPREIWVKSLDGSRIETVVYDPSGVIKFINPVNVATTQDLNATYDNGNSGVGATLTGNSNGALVIDGVNATVAMRVLVKDQNNAVENGIYNVVEVGSVSSPFQLMRSSDFDQATLIEPGDLAPVFQGDVNGNTLWLQTDEVEEIGTDPIQWVQFTIDIPNVVTITGSQTITGAKTMNDLTLGGDMNANSHKIINLANPTNAQDAVTKAYVDSASSTPGGSDGQLQYNDNGAFGGDTGATTDGAGNITVESVAFNDTAAGGIVGTTTNDNASAGYVGELVSSSVASSSAVSMSAGSPANVTSINLTAGDWDVWGNVGIVFSTSSGSFSAVWISLTSATQPDVSLRASRGQASSGISSSGGAVPGLRISLTAPATVYLSAQVNFTTGTCGASGNIFARRVR